MIDQSAVVSEPNTENSTKRPSLRMICSPCVHAGGMAGVLDIDVAAIAAGERAQRWRRHPRGSGLIVDVGAIAPGELEALRRTMSIDDELLRRLQLRHLRHQEAERAGAGDHDDVVELDVAAVDGVDGAGERLDDRGVLERHGRRDLVHARRGGGQSMYSAMPPSATWRWKPKMLCTSHIQYWPERQKRQLVAGHDLLGDRPVADRHAEILGGAVAERLDGAEESRGRGSRGGFT